MNPCISTSGFHSDLGLAADNIGDTFELQLNSLHLHVNWHLVQHEPPDSSFEQHFVLLPFQESLGFL